MRKEVRVVSIRGMPMDNWHAVGARAAASGLTKGEAYCQALEDLCAAIESGVCVKAWPQRERVSHHSVKLPKMIVDRVNAACRAHRPPMKTSPFLREAVRRYISSA